MKQFDLVQLLRTENVKLLSGPKGHVADPNGYWTVTATIKENVMIAKDGTIVVVPVQDVERVGVYDTNKVFEDLKEARHGKPGFDIIKILLEKFKNSTAEKIRNMLIRYNLPNTADSLEETNRILGQFYVSMRNYGDSIDE